MMIFLHLTIHSFYIYYRLFDLDFHPKRLFDLDYHPNHTCFCYLLFDVDFHPYFTCLIIDIHI